MMDGEDGEKQRWYKCKQQLEICNKERQDDDVSHGKNPKRLEKVQELFYQPVLLSEREITCHWWYYLHEQFMNSTIFIEGRCSKESSWNGSFGGNKRT